MEVVEYTGAQLISHADIAMARFREHELSSDDDDIEAIKFCKLTCEDASRSFDQYNSDFNQLDMIITFLNGQRNLYIYSRTFARYKLYMLMFPVITLTSLSILIAPFIMNHQWSGAIISSINAIILFFVALQIHFKLESACASFALLSAQYERLYNTLCLENTHTVRNEYEYSESKVMEYERKITDIHSPINIPSEIKFIFPVIAHVNIFSFIKHVETYKRNLIIQYKDIKNEIRYIRYKGGECEQRKTRYTFLLTTKDTLKNEIIQHKNMYDDIESIFTQEIKKAEAYKWYWIWIIMVGIEPTQYDTNSIIYKHLSL